MTLLIRSRRPGFTVIELTVATTLILILLGLLAGLAAWSFRERAGQRARFLALERANNVLVEANALPWDKLTAEWAQSRPSIDDPFLPGGKIAVTVSDEPNEPGLKRVVAQVFWQIAENLPPADVELVGFFAKGASK